MNDDNTLLSPNSDDTLPIILTDVTQSSIFAAQHKPVDLL
jgi:hypothetical protein